MSKWIKELLWGDKVQAPGFSDDIPKLLSKYNLTPDPKEFITLRIEGNKSNGINNLHQYMAEHAKAFAAYYTREETTPKGCSHVPIQYQKYPVWKVEYIEILAKHAHYYGLKIIKGEEAGTWVLARCYNCETCPRRIDCLTEEY